MDGLRRPKLPSGPASRQTKEHPDTLKAKARRGEIDFEITPSGRWLFDIAGYLDRLARERVSAND